MPGARAAAVVAPVVLLLLAACDTGGGTEPEEAASATGASTTVEEPLIVPPPERFRVKPGPFRARLRWDPSPSGPPLDGYDVYRNGKLVTTVRGDATSFVDGRVRPGRKYRWRLVARAGDLASEAVTANARMPVPPLAAARLEGVFTVRLVTTSHSGYARLGRDPDSLGWEFKPRCAAGPCRRIAWHDLGNKRFRGVLVRAGSRYTGSYVGPFGVMCGGTIMSSQVRLELDVERAGTHAAGWHAWRIRGTLTSSESSQLGCVAASRTQTVRGSLYPSSL